MTEVTGLQHCYLQKMLIFSPEIPSQHNQNVSKKEPLQKQRPTTHGANDCTTWRFVYSR